MKPYAERRIRDIQTRLTTLEIVEALARSSRLRSWLHGLGDDDVYLLASMAERVKAGEELAVIVDTMPPHARARFDALQEGYDL